MLDTIRILLEKCDDKSIEMLLEYIREIKLTEEGSITEQGKMNCCGCSRMTSSYNENQMLYLSLLSEECNVPNIVRRLISEMGITPKYKAHEYIVQGCEIIISKGDISNCMITKEVYPVLARKFKVSPKSVEHAMRSAISQFWEKRALNEKQKVRFDHYFTSKPSNMDFLVKMVSVALDIMNGCQGKFA